MSLIIRHAVSADIESITDIYNEAILTTDATFDTEPKAVTEQMTWFDDHGKKNPILVAEENGILCGWASLSKWSSRSAYADTAEISVYIKREFHNRGIGRRLMQEILEEGEKAGLHTIISRITAGNTASVYLHEELGFEHIGIMREGGKKFDKTPDVCMMQKIYRQPP